MIKEILQILLKNDVQFLNVNAYCYKDKEIIETEQLKLPFISKANLIKNK
jgi:hypothetical protein